MDFCFEIIKIIFGLAGLYLVTRQLYYNRTAAKDKLIYDINKGMEQYSAATDLIESHRDAMRAGHFETEISQEVEKKGVKDIAIAFVLTDEEGKSPKMLARDNLRAFETVMMMLETGIIKEDDIFPLIGYSIIALLNSPLIQKEFLFRKPKNYSAENKSMIQPAFRFASVFALYDRVMIYNIKRFYSWRSSKCCESGDFLE